MNIKRLINAAMDCLSEFNASGFPLKNVANNIVSLRKLNSRERPIFLDLIYRFCREINLVNKFLLETMPFAQGLSIQRKNYLVLSMFAAIYSQPDQQISDLNQAYEKWLSNLGANRHLLALGPLIGEELARDYGHEANIIAQGLLRRRSRYLAVDRRYVSVEKVSETLKALGIDYFHHDILPCALGINNDLHLSLLPKEVQDHVWMMDAGSQIIAALIRPQPHERVLDLCAGEGNKAQYITMQNCDYVACDIDERRLNKAKKRLHNRLIEFVVADGRKLPFVAESFDWILVDAPCSGIGILGRHPDLIQRFSTLSFNSYIELQRELLNSAVNLLKVGGKLIYATCSLFKKENDQQINAILAKNKHIAPFLLRDLVDDSLKFNKAILDKNSFSLFPHIDNCDGFYLAALIKRSSMSL